MKYHEPLDPSCPAVARFSSDLHDDPMTKAMGAPVDEIMEGFARKHRMICPRCRAYGVANIEVR